MKTVKLTQLLFSVAVIAALVAAAIPAAPAYAAPAASTGTTIGAASADTPVLGPGVLVCKSVTRWIHGHRVTVRVCHRVYKPGTR
jgi:hypothetical protein